MFHRKDVVPLVFLLLVIVTIMITLSQILVVHNKHHPVQPDPRDLEKFKVILVQLERHINSMLKKDVLPLSEYRKVFAAEIYAARINDLLKQEEMNAYRGRNRQADISGTYDFSNESNGQKELEGSHNRRTTAHLLIDYIDRTNRYNISTKKTFYVKHKHPQTRKDAFINNGNKHVFQSKPHRKESNLSQTGNNTKRQFSKTSDVSIRNKRIFHRHLYQTNTVPGLKSSRSLLIQPKVNGGDVPNESLDIDNPTDLFPPLLTGDQSVIREVTAARDETNRFLQQNGRQGNHHVTPCLEYPIGLAGRIRVSTKLNITRVMFKDHTDVQPGGWWTPPCLPRHKVAIIVPYRDRQHHLLTLLYYLIPVLKRQLIEFRIFVVEQDGNHTFNKGLIMNAGFKEAVRLSEYHCYIFHDVDLIPEDDRNLYSCPGLPRHLSVAVDKFKYKLPYGALVGGVFAIRRMDFETVNGYSNLYWGWGAEDDDMYIRLNVAGLQIVRPSATVARYKMMKHKGRVHAPGKWTDYLLKTVKKRFYKDGLSTVNYNVTFIHLERLFTHIMVNVGQPPTIVGNISAIIR